MANTLQNMGNNSFQFQDNGIENPCVGGSIPSLGTTYFPLAFSALNSNSARCSLIANNAIKRLKQYQNAFERISNIGRRIASFIGSLAQQIISLYKPPSKPCKCGGTMHLHYGWGFNTWECDQCDAWEID